MRTRRLWPPVLLSAALLLASMLAVTPLFTHPNLPRGDDVGEHVQFVQDFSAGQRQGLIYPRWFPQSNLGYGAPAFLFYPPLATALVATLFNAGLDLFTAFAMGFFILTLGGALTAALLGNRQREAAGLLGAGLTGILWILLPYHAVDVYGRFALAEVATFIFIPLFLLALDRSSGPRKRLLAGSFAGLCLAHLPSAFLAAWMALAWVGFRHRRHLPATLLALLLGAGCAAIYVGPSIMERPFVHADWLENNPHYRFDAHYLLYPAHIQVDQDEVHGNYSGHLEAPTLQRIRLVVPATLLLAMGAWGLRLLLLRRHPGIDPLHRYAILSLCATLGMTRLADPVWRWIPGFASVVFPWRLTLLLTVAAAVLAGTTLAILLHHRRLLATAALMVMAIPAFFLSYQASAGADWQTFSRQHAETPVVRLRVAGAFMPRSNSQMRGFRDRPRAGLPSLSAEGEPEAGAIHSYTALNQHHIYQVEATAAGATLEIPQFDYPGWVVHVDGRKVAHSQRQGLGTILVPLNPGLHTVQLSFGQTTPRVLSAVISITSMTILVALTGLRLRRTMPHRSPS